MVQCKCITKAGTQCKRQAVPPSPYCTQHRNCTSSLPVARSPPKAKLAQRPAAVVAGRRNQGGQRFGMMVPQPPGKPTSPPRAPFRDVNYGRAGGGGQQIGQMEVGAVVARQPPRNVGRAARGGQRVGQMEEGAVINNQPLNRSNCKIGMRVMFSDDKARKSYIGEIIACNPTTAKVQTSTFTRNVPYAALTKREYSPVKNRNKPCAQPTDLQVEHTDQWCEFKDAELCITDLMQTDLTKLRRMLNGPEGNHDEVNALLEADDFWKIKLERDTNCDPTVKFHRRPNETPLYAYIRAMDNYLINSGFSEDVKESIRQRIG